VTNETSCSGVSPGTPGRLGQHRSDDASCQFRGRSLNRHPRAICFRIQFCLSLIDTGRSCLSRGIERRIRLGVALMQPLFASAKCFGAGLSQPLGVLGGLGLSLGNGPLGVFNRPHRERAPSLEHLAQRAVNQKSIRDDQHNEQENGRHGVEQKVSELIEGLLHAGLCRFSILVVKQDTFLYQGRNTMVNAGRDTLDGGL